MPVYRLLENKDGKTNGLKRRAGNQTKALPLKRSSSREQGRRDKRSEAPSWEPDVRALPLKRSSSRERGRRDKRSDHRAANKDSERCPSNDRKRCRIEDRSHIRSSCDDSGRRGRAPPTWSD